MTVVKQAIGEHDVVKLRDRVGAWPAGRVGAVVSDYGDVKLVEIANQHGEMLDLIQVAERRLELVAKYTA
jgi:hypothetical protein